jgi:hypothetical protein
MRSSQAARVSSRPPLEQHEGLLFPGWPALMVVVWPISVIVTGVAGLPWIPFIQHRSEQPRSVFRQPLASGRSGLLRAMILPACCGLWRLYSATCFVAVTPSPTVATVAKRLTVVRTIPNWPYAEPRKPGTDHRRKQAQSLADARAEHGPERTPGNSRAKRIASKIMRP